MEDTAAFHPVPGKIPLHVGIIPDGGRRWASAHGCSLQEAYLKSRSLLGVVVKMMFNEGVKEISIYLSSIQNFRRQPEDLDPNLEIVEYALNTEITEIAGKLGLCVCVAGNRNIFPSTLKEAAHNIEHLTAGNCTRRLNLLIAYDPLGEIAQAVAKSNNTPDFYKHLWVQRPLDLVIRSGGAQLLSNFLPLQSGYARLYFFKTLFNDLEPADFQKVLEDFRKIERKFGD